MRRPTGALWGRRAARPYHVYRWITPADWRTDANLAGLLPDSSRAVRTQSCVLPGISPAKTPRAMRKKRPAGASRLPAQSPTSRAVVETSSHGARRRSATACKRSDLLSEHAHTRRGELASLEFRL